MAELFFSLVFFLGILGIVFGIITFIRNEAVYRYRTDLLGKVSEAAQRDINEGRYVEWRDRYEDFNSVSYQEQVIKFWKPLDSFYPNKSFIE